MPEFPARLIALLVRSPVWFSAALAVVLLMIAFPDIVFEGATFRQTDQLVAAYDQLPVRSLYPHWAHQYWYGSYNDTGGAVFQSEPMMEFMRHNIWTMDSPYWNPYSSGGALGPETLIDQKFSVLTVAYALLGGGTRTFDALILLSYFIGTFFSILMLRRMFQMPAVACAGGGVFLLLNGYSTANVASNVYYSFMFIPPALYASLNLVYDQSRLRFILLTLAFAVLLSFTFLPTTMVGLLAIFGLTFGYAASITRRAIQRLLVVHFGALFLALFLLAFLYFPIIESVRDGLLGYLNDRTLSSSMLVDFLSLFTSSHYLESYQMRVQYPGYLLVNGFTVFHCGIVALAIAAASLNRTETRWRCFIICAVVLAALVLARIFAIPGIASLASLLPMIRGLGAQYWWVAVMIPLVPLIGFGLRNIVTGHAGKWGSLGVLIVAAIAAFWMDEVYGLREPNIPFKLVSLALLAAFGALGVGAIWYSGVSSPLARARIAWFVVCLLFCQLVIDAKAMRRGPDDIFASPPPDVQFVKDNIGQQRTMTLFLFGPAGERGAAYQIPEISSLNIGVLPDYVRFLNSAVQLDRSQKWGELSSFGNAADRPDLDHFDWDALNFLGVKYVILPSFFTKFQEALMAQGLQPAFQKGLVSVLLNPNAMPHAFSIDVPILGDSLELPLDLKGQYTPVRISHYRNASVELVGEADGSRLVVLTDNWHHNWKALLNGKRVSIIRVNKTFRGIEVPAGPFRIEMTYRPSTLIPGIAVSLVSLLVLLSIAFWSRVKKVIRVGDLKSADGVRKAVAH